MLQIRQDNFEYKHIATGLYKNKTYFAVYDPIQHFLNWCETRRAQKFHKDFHVCKTVCHKSETFNSSVQAIAGQASVSDSSSTKQNSLQILNWNSRSPRAEWTLQKAESRELLSYIRDAVCIDMLNSSNIQTW